MTEQDDTPAPHDMDAALGFNVLLNLPWHVEHTLKIPGTNRTVRSWVAQLGQWTLRTSFESIVLDPEGPLSHYAATTMVEGVNAHGQRVGILYGSKFRVYAPSNSNPGSDISGKDYATFNPAARHLMRILEATQDFPEFRGVDPKSVLP